MSGNEGENKTLEEIGKALTSISDVVKNLSGTMTQFGKRFDAIDAEVKGLKINAPEKKPEKKTITDTDLEALDRKGFLGVILDQVGDVISQKLEPLSKGIKGVQTDVENRELAEQITDAKKAYPDFAEWTKESAEIFKRANGSMTISESYEMARRRNVDKANEMDEKYKLGKFADKEKKEEDMTKEIFGGLTPTSGKTVEGKNMSPTDAAEAAWDEVFSGSGKK